MSGGSAGSAYAAEISALQTYQKQILTTLDTMVADEAAMTVLATVTSVATGTGGNNGLGTFPEAVQLSKTYSSVMQSLMTNFQEISALVTAMAGALGKSAQSYLETEQQITDSFNQIVQKYESKSGGFSTPGSPTPTAPTGTSPQTGTSDSYYTATASQTPTTTSASSSASSASSSSGSSSSGSGSGSSGGSGTGSIAQGNTSNASNNTSSEE
jgi:uncharacterized membrane protein YgcG